MLVLPAHSDALKSVCVTVHLNFCPIIRLTARSSRRLPRPQCKTGKSATNARIFLFNNSLFRILFTVCFFVETHSSLRCYKGQNLTVVQTFDSANHFLTSVLVVKTAQLQIWVEKATLEITREHNFCNFGHESLFLLRLSPSKGVSGNQRNLFGNKLTSREGNSQNNQKLLTPFDRI